MPAPRPTRLLLNRGRGDPALETAIADLMTSSAATAAIHVLRDGSVFTTIVIAFTFEIIRMTGSAEGRVLGRGPGNGTANGVTVAPITPRIPSVVAGIVSIGIMTKDGWCPAVGAMTHVTLFSRG